MCIRDSQDATQSLDRPRPLGYERIFPGDEYDERKCTEGVGDSQFGGISEETESKLILISPDRKHTFLFHLSPSVIKRFIHRGFRR